MKKSEKIQRNHEEASIVAMKGQGAEPTRAMAPEEMALAIFGETASCALYPRSSLSATNISSSATDGTEMNLSVFLSGRNERKKLNKKRKRKKANEAKRG